MICQWIVEPWLGNSVQVCRELTAMKTILWSFDGTLHIIVHSEAVPTDAEWDAYLAAFPAGDLLSHYKVIVYSLGGGPNGAQRVRLVNLIRARPPRVALLTGSSVMRGIGTAVSWFIRSLKVFPLPERAAAFRYLDMSPNEEQRANETIDRFVRELAGQGDSALPRN